MAAAVAAAWPIPAAQAAGGQVEQGASLVIGSMVEAPKREMALYMHALEAAAHMTVRITD